MTTDAVTAPDYSLLEEFFDTHPAGRDYLWWRIKEDPRLMLFYKALALPVNGGSLTPDELTAVNHMIDEILARPQLNQVYTRTIPLIRFLEGY